MLLLKLVKKTQDKQCILYWGDQNIKDPSGFVYLYYFFQNVTF